MFSLGTKIKLNSVQVLALGFIAIILLGTVLLALPIASRNHASLSFIDALFTATSATCVTGLVACDTYTQFTVFGQIVILLLIQTGGLGFMTVAIFFSIIIGKRIGLKERGLLMESVSTPQIGGVVRLVKRVLIGTAICEILGTVLLSLRFCPDMGLAQGVWNALFHSVSAFCNAGFDLMGRVSPYASLTPYANDTLVNVVVMTLIVLGGMGFIVWNDLLENRFRFSQLRLHTKVVLVTTAVLVVLPALLFFLLENEHAFAGMGTGERVLASFFQSISPRTAGFNTVNISALSESGSLLTMLLMFIGASPGSTAGGIKTTTFVTIVFCVLAYAQNRQDVNLFHRRLEASVIRRAFCSASMYTMMAITGGFLLSAVQGFSIKDAMFEALSAIGTVGLTTGITTMLAPISQLIIILLMFSGRVGSISVAMAVAERNGAAPLKNPEERITVG